ncbi:efflux RND transporter periplasmic adaptor subunit [Paracoccus laeviglucosivorans]|uniref:RND family efflux transporter, MFP subunit n=1 Tax=Paracoccus laeviglucosivorans TaxID=1197861 RepID=A0A521DRM6_9RHOB|nr:efflux RND transporter periplasmic adaptor subunit [Paracoccus laeviglucosivorans]SMO74235.1 RND family efflux transporter, MFP subunit [Paracoccus laeviglucosivorans]
MILRTLLAVLFAAAAFPAAAWPWSPAPEKAADRPRPIASIIVSDTMPNDHSIPGVIRARTEVSLAFQTLGRLSQRLVDIGAVVRKDQLLAALDPKDLQDDVRAAQATADAASVELRTAQATAERTRALARRNVATTAQLEQAEQTLVAATAAAQQSQSELVRARDAELFAEMRAPFDGVISDVTTNPGAVVNAGDTIMQLAAQNDLEAVIDLHPAMLARMKDGDQFEIWSESDPGNLSAARISLIEPVADAATRTRRVHLALDRPEGFRLGALVRARPSMQGMKRVTVPASAILTQDGAPYVWVVSTAGNGRTVALRPVQMAGAEIGGTIGILSGIDPGDEVVVRGVNSLSDGQAVGASVRP